MWHEQWQAGRGDLPKEFFEQPEVDLYLEPHFLAFDELDSERHFGMGVGPIPRSKIKQYAFEELELDGDALEEFCAIVARVDSAYVSMVNQPRDPKTAASVKDTDAVKRMFDRAERSQNEHRVRKKKP